ncbi:MAG: OmpA family protein [Bacteroidia bacterium]|nr:OmpA family protein [Bacteroidia bacterium]MDW8348354.1 OmpA family protein [Bacteroidia bacterium]
MLRTTYICGILFAFLSIYAQSPVLNFEKDFLNTFTSNNFTLQNPKGKFTNLNTQKGTRRVYIFDSNQGFTLYSLTAISKIYTIEMVLQLSEVESYARILNFNAPTADVGIYARNSTVVFYPKYKSNLRILRPNEWFHLTLTRCENNIFSAYINGNIAFQFRDSLSMSTVYSTLIFFDDDGTESRPGILGTLNIFDECLNESNIATRAQSYLEEYGQKKIEGSTPLLNQTYYEYRFEGNFNPENGKGPTLKPIGKGTFEIENISGCGKKGVYYFEENAGFTFENKGFITSEHTIELYFKFNNLKSWKRIVDYKNRQSDTGPYAFDNQIEFYKVAISKNFPFRENTYAHVVLVREANENYSLYVDGLLRTAFKDINELALLSREDVLHFFRDDLQVPNECSSGAIAFLRIYNFAITPEQIAENSKKMPCPNTLITQNTKPKEVKQVIIEKPKENPIPQKPITYKLTLKVVDEITQKEVNARITVKNKEQAQLLIDTLSSEVSRSISEGVYHITVEGNNYLPMQEEIAVMKGSVSKVIALKKIEIGTTVTLENIYFEPNSDKIAVESYPNLISFANYLKSKPNLKIRINGHTDIGSPGTSSAYLMELSQKRADAVVNFLVKNGVNPEQLQSKGYGNTRPIAPNDTPEGKAKNRRVEFEVLEK